MQISHILFTRFNIQYEADESIGIQSTWLENRLLLFEKYCLPSVQKQTSKNFTWILLGDIRTPEKYKMRIENYRSIVPQIRTYWVSYQTDGYHTVYKEIGQEFANDKNILISTRLDNDDALSADYMEQIQKIAENGTDGIITFPLGKQTFATENKSVPVRYVQNHFLSRIENSHFETIMVFDHSLLETTALLHIETKQPMWEEIVHGGNIHNDFEPKYQYFIHDVTDLAFILKQWLLFIAKRISLIVRKHK